MSSYLLFFLFCTLLISNLSIAADTHYIGHAANKYHVRRRMNRGTSPLVRGHHAKLLEQGKSIRGMGDSNIPPYKTNWFNQKFDHYSFDPLTQSKTWKQRYLTYDGFVKGKVNTIVFYTGNEGAIDLFWENTGLAFTLAEEYDAMVIFAEHRYYGLSMPFGKDSFKGTNYRYLTMAQALGDYVHLLETLKRDLYMDEDIKIVALGGSYGVTYGAVSHFPGTFTTGIAGSAPIFQTMGFVDPEAFSHHVTWVYDAANHEGTNVIRNSWAALSDKSSSPTGLREIQNKLHLCSAPKNKTVVESVLYGYLENAFVDVAMANYPMPTSFLFPDLPSWPVNVTVDAIASQYSKSKDILDAIYAGMNIMMNSSKTETCFDWEGNSTPSLGMSGWSVQSCNEMVLLADGSLGGDHDMFWYAPQSLAASTKMCQETYQISPEPHYFQRIWTGTKPDDIATYANIFYSNGDLDPWSTGGVCFTGNDDQSDQENNCAINKDSEQFHIWDGAHHVDLRSPSSYDTPAIVEAHSREEAFIRKHLQ